MPTYVFLPPIKKTAGGMAVLKRIARVLFESGQEVFFALREQGGFLDERVPVVQWDELRLGRDDIWLVPEGWVNALTPGLEAGARCLNYCQNWAYLFSAMPEGVHWSSLPVSFLAVSQPVSWFIGQTVGREAPILRPGIDRDLFRPVAKPSGRVRIACMPRKNSALAKQIRQIFQARNHADTDVIWEEISGLDQQGVAQALGRSHIFLATGFPEGCPLPPLEAMACGCLPVGFSGFGGWDYMRQVREDGFSPWWPLRDASWSGNGFWSADSDVLDAALNLERAVALVREGGEPLKAVLEAGQQTADAYSLENQKHNILDIWKSL